MGLELEYKLAVSSPPLLKQILYDPIVTRLRRDEFQTMNMATVYYDTEDLRLSTLHWTLRLRQENNQLIATLKTPAQDRVRGEWSVPATNIRDAIPMLLEDGAPRELTLMLQGQTLKPLCAARFTREYALVELREGTVCEICGDLGTLAGGGREEPLCEIEVELKDGPAAPLEAFVRDLQARYKLREETRGKFVRAAALAKE